MWRMRMGYLERWRESVSEGENIENWIEVKGDIIQPKEGTVTPQFI